ncbi:SRPBCC family protein [Streptomyces albipurpureus]|uniref:SRPBCC family protein n=1 Tax=Streptomyces albipurpureus TaxID=2897419 RepID=A0ABT0UW85_9ACTN|nr:SRPBCC family protein [Streptomyces sp. CWNU-1]MCM2392853.1 SRPBCC family protein [Streptomyces sp. CWNU-1]
MDWFHYRFHSVWDLDAPPDTVYAALARVEDYPGWWPQVREVTLLGEDMGSARFRSFLPYELRAWARTRRQDPIARVLEVDLRGDLEGWARWTVTARKGGGEGGGGSTRAVYDQEVEVRKPLMRWLAPLARPLFRANHAAMMRAGHRGLAAKLGRE